MGEGLLIKHDASGGSPIWTRTIESAPGKTHGRQFTGAKGVAAYDTGVYVGDNLMHAFAGQVNDGSQAANGQCGPNEDPFFSKLDAYVRRFDFEGNVIWARQFGVV